MKNMKTFLNNEKNVLVLLLILSLIFINKGFLNFYIIVKNDFSKRVLKHAGFCSKQGYGFTKYVIEKFEIKNKFIVKNYEDYPSSEGYFYDYKNRNKKKQFLILINLPKEIFEKNYSSLDMVYNKDNCYLVKMYD